MLVEFSVENFRSIKQEARLSLVAGPAKERSDTHLVVPTLRKKGGRHRPFCALPLSTAQMQQARVTSFAVWP